jgi:hypothetical protein
MAKKPKVKARKTANNSNTKQNRNTKQAIDRKLEEGLEETFPGSDPLAVTDPVRSIKE